MKQELSEVDIARILEAAPFRWPWRLVDRVTAIVPFESIEGRKCVASSEPWFAGERPQRVVLPGVLLLEALAQLGSILVYTSEPFDTATSLMYLLGFDKVKFRRPVHPGDVVDLTVRVLRHDQNAWKLAGEASVEGTLAAQAELLASVVDHDS